MGVNLVCRSEISFFILHVRVQDLALQRLFFALATLWNTSKSLDFFIIHFASFFNQFSSSLLTPTRLPIRSGVWCHLRVQNLMKFSCPLSCPKSRACIQWIPSHVGVFGNEVADLLAKEGSALPSATSGELFVSEISSIHRAKANFTW
ncbi:hypothetical protein AVEN_216571-1 [Araneus ventricosus]|uniref:RNase H type-1 domain-containing protein n=1 Tax=Araneus ventricosus TaxID=182803 RepID=A0A4Y2G2H4_ARAVE|nr:hypothetical protein AVEN_216571-1 [Araneus ventricosus]